jgi:type III pantothenate kinase
MILLVDAGNTRLKWEVRDGRRVAGRGVASMSELGEGACFPVDLPPVSGVAVSTVVSEAHRDQLAETLRETTGVSPHFYWAEASRGGLLNAYRDPSRMGADRWHAMYGAWQRCRSGFAVVDAGSAVTVDYVASDGRHLGGYILPGRNMMIRSLQVDAARIGFKTATTDVAKPGTDTGECVLHGQVWLTEALQGWLERDLVRYSLGRVFVTGGDGQLFRFSGLAVDRAPSLVLDGLEAIAREESAR